MKRILESIKDTFPDFDENEFGKELRLGDIPDFDSMSAINLQVNLESKFGIKLFGLPLRDHVEINAIIKFLQEKDIILYD